MKEISIKNVIIPIKLDKHLNVFELEASFTYYPTFIRQAKIDFPFAAYVSHILKEVDRAKLPITGDDLFQEYLMIFGIEHYGKHINIASKVYNEG